MIKQKLFENFAHPVDAGLAAVDVRTMPFDLPAVMVIGHRA
jgi:hypothetical protein